MRTRKSKHAPVPISQEMLIKLARSPGVLARRRSIRLNSKAQDLEISDQNMDLRTLVVRATQGDLIEAFNNFLQDHRDPTFRGLRLSMAGLCHGVSHASSHFPDFEKMKEEILSATPAVRKRLGSTAWNHIQKILSFIALAQLPSEPWEGGVRKVNFLNVPQARSYEVVVGEAVRPYTPCLDEKQITTALGKLKEDALASQASASLPIIIKKHSIEIGFRIGKGFYINDPNAHKISFHHAKHMAAKEIIRIYKEVNGQGFVNPFTPTSKIFIHVSLRERDQLPSFERYMNYWSTRSISLREDASEMSALTMLIFTGNFQKVSGFLESQFRRDFIDDYFKENDTSYLLPFLKHIPQGAFIQLLKNEDFITFIRNGKPYSDEEFDALLYSFRLDTTTQVTAAILYAAVKRAKQSLSSLMLTMFEAFHDARLVGLNYPNQHDGIDYAVLNFLDIEEVIKLIQKTTDIQTKVLLSQVCNLKLKKGYFIQKFSEDKYSLLLLKLYFSNSLTEFKHYSDIILNAARASVDVQRREFLRRGLGDAISQIVCLSIMDNKLEWTINLLLVLANLNALNAQYWMHIMIQYDKTDVFINFAQNFTFTPEQCFKLLCVAIENSTLSTLEILIRFFSEKGVLKDALIYANSYGDTVLHTATYKGKTEYVKAFLALGCVQYVSARGETPLYIACAMGHVEIAELLIMQNQTSTQYNMPDGRSIFLAAKNSLNPHMLEQLILFLYKKNPIETIRINSALGFVVKPHTLQPNSPALPSVALAQNSPC